MTDEYYLDKRMRQTGELWSVLACRKKVEREADMLKKVIYHLTSHQQHKMAITFRLGHILIETKKGTLVIAHELDVNDFRLKKGEVLITFPIKSHSLENKIEIFCGKEPSPYIPPDKSGLKRI